jgi:hypothetical protein
VKKVLIFLYVISFYFVVFSGEVTTNNLRIEDGPIENLGAMLFIAASILYFVCFLRSSRLEKSTGNSRSNKKYFYLFFAFLFFVGFGEEISWGQRLVGWETPKIFQEINRQKETNIHNLKVLGEGILRPDVLFFTFWFSYCLILPLVDKYYLDSRKYTSRFGLPVPPLWIGYLLLTNFLIYLIPQSFSSDWRRTYYIDSAFREIMESNAAFIFTVLAFHELKNQSIEKIKS